MPTLFISYKRGTSAVAPLMERLKKAHYRLWFDRDEIHLGDTDWQARIDQGIALCDGLILNLTPAACESEPVQYEVKKALELKKPIFPIVLEKIENWAEALTQVGLTPSQHTEDFTDVAQWDAQIKRLIRDLEIQGLRVSPHDRRQERDRNNPNYVLHQRYLRRLVERIGTLKLSQINPENTQGVDLERVYVDSPTGLGISVEVQDWQVIDWWISNEIEDRQSRFRNSDEELPRRKPTEMGYEVAPFETLVGQIDAQLQQEREKESIVSEHVWRHGIKHNRWGIHLNHLAAARDRLVILGAPGSGKITFVKYLALCLAGSGIDNWTRPIGVDALDNWPHGALTPIYVELRRFVASEYFPAEIDTPATADHLWAYIQQDLLGDDLQDYTDDLRYDLEHGHAVLILDGLDEVPYPEGKLKQRQAQLIALADGLNTRYATSRAIVASRPYAYEGWTLPGFEAVTITAFNKAHRIDLAGRLYQVAGLSEDDAQEKAQALDNQLKSIDPELKDRPLFVTLMATIYLKGEKEGLPTRRGALYRESILLLLDRWTTGKANAPSLVELLGDKGVHDLYERLAALAYDVHDSYGDQPGTPEIDESALYKHLKPLGRTTAAELIPYLSENAGVLVSPGQDDEKDVFHFAHRTFQEYLAAAHLTTLCQKADSFKQVADHITEKPQIWRIPGALVGDVLADTERSGNLRELLEDLIDDEALDNMTATDPGWWRVWLASVVVEEQLFGHGKELGRSKRVVQSVLVERLVDMVNTAAALEPTDRARCGRILARIGDPRPGIGVKDGLPEIAWSEVIEPGEYPIGGDEEAWKPLDGQTHKLEYSYQVSKYPITYTQFGAFMAAEDGLSSAEHDWFAGLAADDDDKPMRDQEWPYANHPRETVNWYQAVAFCRWLSYKLTGRVFTLEEIREWPIRLPHEKEWEIAARGPDALIFPYGNESDAQKGNTVETRIGGTSAVGLFPDGMSWCGAYDMSGNVWEWGINQYNEPDAKLTAEHLSGSEARVLRGGSWSNYQRFARCAFRLDRYPRHRYYGYGFRVLVLPHLLSR